MRFFALGSSARMEIKMSEPYFQNENQAPGAPSWTPEPAPQTFPRVENYIPYTPPKPVREAKKSLKCAVLFAFSLLLLLFSLCPLIHTTTEVNGREYSISFNSIDCLKVAFNSARSLSSSAIVETKQYKELMEEYSDGLTSLSEIPVSRLSDYLKSALLLQLMSEDTPTRFSYVIAALAVITYLTLCIVIFVYAIMALVGELVLTTKRSDEENLHVSKGASLLLYTLLFMPLLYYTLVQMCSFGSCFALSALASRGIGASYGFVLSVAAALLGSAYFLLPSIMDMVRSGGVKVLLKKSSVLLSLGFTLIFLISFSFLCLSAHVSVEENGREYEEDFSINYYDINEITYDDVSDFYKYLSYGSNDVMSSAMKELTNDRKSDTSRILLVTATVGGGVGDLSIAYVFVILLNYCALLIFAFLAYDLIKNIQDAPPSERIGSLKKLLCLIASIQIILVFIIFAFLNGASIGGDGCLVAFKMGVGPILGLLSTIGMLISFEKQPQKEIEPSYDNPDVSYAPYVVDGIKK